MPFANLNLPSIELTQPRSVHNREGSANVRTEICCLNHAFAEPFGFNPHVEIVGTINLCNRGLGCWIFRGAAFRDLPDSALEYFRQYFSRKAKKGQRLRVDRIRPQINDFTEELIDRYELNTFDIVGSTSMFSQTVPSIALARQIRKRAAQYGLDLEPLSFCALTDPFSKEALAETAYYFSDGNYTAAHLQTIVRHIARLQRALAAWWQSWSQSIGPDLYIQRPGEMPILYESCSGVAETLELTTAAGRVLASLSHWMSKSVLCGLLPEFGADEVENSRRPLQDRAFFSRGRSLREHHSQTAARAGPA
jgi:hypothetical protein